MREILHQLTLALALPITVTAVWIVRGEPSGTRPFESAAAYRAQLAPLPLPTTPKLRAPREAIDSRRAPRETELPLAPRRRAVQPEVEPARPLALAATGEPAPALIAAPRLRAAEAAPAPAATAPGLAPRSPLPFVATLPGIASSAVPASARVSVSAAKAGAAVATPESAARAGAGAAPAAASNPSVRAPVASADFAKAPAIAKFTALDAAKAAAAASAKPTQAAPVLAAAPAARERSAEPAPAIATPGSARALHAAGSPAMPESASDTLETLEKNAQKRAVTSAPALAQGMQELSEALDLLLGDASGNGSPFEQLVPTLPASTPLPEPAAPAPAPVAVLPAVPGSAPDRLGFAFPVLETLMAQLDDFAAASDAASFANERRYPPVLTVSAIPEPASALLMGAGLAAVAAACRRDRRG